MSRCDMPPCSMSWPANTNRGIASNVDESVPAAVSMTSTSTGKPRYNRVRSDAASNETATDTPTASNSANVPNRTVSAISASPAAVQPLDGEQHDQRAAGDEGQEIQAHGQRRARCLELPSREHEARSPAGEHDADRGSREAAKCTGRAAAR